MCPDWERLAVGTINRSAVRSFGAPTPRRWVSTAVPWVPVVLVEQERPTDRTTERPNAFR